MDEAIARPGAEPAATIRPSATARAGGEWRYYAVLGVVTAAATWHSLWLGSFDVRVPYAYVGDTLQYLEFFRTIFETGWYTEIPRLGAPFGTTHYDYPVPDGLFLMVGLLLRPFTDNPAIPFNLLFVAGFAAAAFSFFWVARRIGLDAPLAIVGALAYAFLPFHLQRVGHMFYTLYFVHPLVLASALELGRAGPLSWREWVRWPRVALFVVVGAAGIYGAFFAMLVLGFAAVAAALALRDARRLAYGAVAATVVGVSVLANLAPNLWYQLEHGRNRSVAQRAFGESETYGLKLAQVLLPNELHRVPAMRAQAERYLRGAPLVNENRTSALGVIGAAGFVIGTLSMLFRRRHAFGRWADDADALARLNLFLLLFASVGGGAVLFAMFVSPQLRAWNRISVVIAAASLLVLMMAVQRWIDARPAARVRRLAVATIALAVVWAVDQGSMRYMQVEPTRAAWASDGAFVRAVAGMLPAGSMILQMPYVAYPESPLAHEEGTFGLLVPYLHGTTLRWSYGAMKGRPEDAWNRALARMPLADQIAIAASAGFAGIAVDRTAFADRGRQREAELAALVGRATIESADQRLVFYRLPPADPAGRVAPMLELLEGFYDWEGDRARAWVWSGGNAVVGFVNFGAPQDVTLRFGTQSLAPRSLVIEQDGRLVRRIDILPGQLVPVAVDLSLPRGRSTLRLRSAEPPTVPGPADPRALAFALVDPAVEARR